MQKIMPEFLTASSPGEPIPGQFMEMPVALTIGQLEEAITYFFTHNSGVVSKMILGLERCEFIEVASLIRLIELMSSRALNGYQTTLHLPHNKDVRDFLRAWRFPEAIQVASGQSFREYLTPEDIKNYWGENPADKPAGRYGSIEVPIAPGTENPFPKGFFHIVSFLPRIDSSPTEIAGRESKKWKDDLVISVLDRVLKGQGSKVASHIIHESMMNATRHPGARIIQATSHFGRPKRQPSSLEIKEVRDWVMFASFFAEGSAQHYRPIANRILSFLPEGIQKMLSSVAAGARPRGYKGQIVFAINAILKKDDLFKNDSIQLTPSSKEINDATKLADIESEPKFIVRKNRLVLEALFPDIIDPSSRGYLTIVVWDDGQSIPETIKNVLKAGKSIRSVNIDRLHFDYDVTTEWQDSGEIVVERINTSWVPDIETPSEKLLLSALFPGITSDVEAKKGRNVDSAVFREDEVLGFPGMGLYVLANQVVDVFGGMLSIRTDKYFLNVKTEKGLSKEMVKRHSAKLEIIPDHVPPFRGNMITVRLPLQPGNV